MRENFKIIFFGTPEFAVPALKELIANKFNITACVTKPDKAQGRRLKIQPSPVRILAEENKIPVLAPEKINDQEFFLKLKNLKPDVIIVIAYGKILPKEIIYLPTFHSLNIHASLLPKYRGASPIHSALLNGDEETGVTIMKMDENMDTGPILTQEKTKIESNETFGTLQDKLANIGSRLLNKTLDDYFGYRCQPKEQNDKEASYTRILKKEDGKIRWHDKAEKIERMIRAFAPWPGTFTTWEGENLKIIEGALSSQKKDNTSPGTILLDKNKMLVNTGTYLLQIKKLQLAGSKVLSAKEFISGYPDIKNGQFV